jgi:3-oxoadipate enol-lactonase
MTATPAETRVAHDPPPGELPQELPEAPLDEVERSLDFGCVPAGRRVRLPGRGTTFVRELAGPAGGNAPPVLLLHGLGATGALNCACCFEELAERHRVVAIDHRGHGRGIRCDRFRLADCADDAAALIEEELGGRAVVAGYSMGGPIAQLLALRHPHLVEGLVLCATSRDFRGRPIEAIRFTAMAPAALLGRLVPAGPGLPLLASAPGRLGDLGFALDEVGRHQPARVMEATTALGRFTSREWAPRLTMPAAVVATCRDEVVPVRRQLKLAAALDAAVVPTDGDHFAPRRAPEDLSRAVTDAVAFVSGRRRLRSVSVA